MDYFIAFLVITGYCYWGKKLVVWSLEAVDKWG